MATQIILSLHENAKRALENLDRVNEIISAEIFSQKDPALRQAVLKHLIHKPCTDDVDAVCKWDGKCTKRFPKAFRVETSSTEGDYYISHKRRSPSQGGDSATISIYCGGNKRKDIPIDNSWVVPHSRELIRKFQCHLNA